MSHLQDDDIAYIVASDGHDFPHLIERIANGNAAKLIRIVGVSAQEPELEQRLRERLRDRDIDIETVPADFVIPERSHVFQPLRGLPLQRHPLADVPRWSMDV